MNVVHAETTQWLIDNSPIASIGDLVVTHGFYSLGDGGGAMWRKIEEPATPTEFSRQPAFYLKGELADASGYIYELTIAESAYPEVNVKQFGAKGDQVASDTAAIQAAINFTTRTTSRGHSILFPSASYRVDATLDIPAESSGLTLKGEGSTRTTLFRDTDYGDTLVIGDLESTPSPANFSVTEATNIEDIFFQHYYGGYENGEEPNTMINKPTFGVHIKAWNTSRLNISRCMLWNMPTNLEINGGAKCRIEGCSFRGVWDPITPQLQVTHQSILIKIIEWSASPKLHSIPTDIQFIDNDLNGYLSPERLKVWGPSGSQVVDTSENIGPINGVRIESCEVLKISGGTIGGHSGNGVFLNPKEGFACISPTISNVFFDGNGETGIKINNETALQPCVNPCITDNIFIGQNNSLHAIWIGELTSTIPSVAGGIIANNNISFYVRTAIMLLSAKGLNINNNIIRRYNSRGLFSNNQDSSGILVGSECHHMRITSNSIGGGVLFENYTDANNINNQCNYGITVATGALDYHIIGNSLELTNTPIDDLLDNAATSNKRIINNAGYNEKRTAVFGPTLASGIAVVNPFGSPAAIKVFDGNVSQILVNGNLLGASSPFNFQVAPGDEVTVVYTLTPQWIWWPQ